MPFQAESYASKAVLAPAMSRRCSAATVSASVGRTALMLVTSKRSPAFAASAAPAWPGWLSMSRATNRPRPIWRSGRARLIIVPRAIIVSSRMATIVLNRSNLGARYEAWDAHASAGIAGSDDTCAPSASSHHPRHRKQPRPFCIRRLDRLLGAEHHHPALGRDLRHGVAELADVGGRGRQDLLAHALARLVGIADQIALHRRKALGVGKPVGIDLPDRADDVAGQFRRAQVGAPQEISRAVIDVERGEQVGVAVGYEGEIARIAVEHALAAVSAALHPDLVPQPTRAKISARHQMGAAWLYALTVKIRAFADIVNLRRHHEALAVRSVRGPPRRGRHGRERQAAEEIRKLRLEPGPIGGLRRDIAQHGCAIDKRRADALQRRQHAVPAGLHIVGELAQEEQVAHPAHLLLRPIGLMQSSAQAAVDVTRSRRHNPGLKRRL